jgi:elongation of very long chain fatty acids protein 4
MDALMASAAGPLAPVISAYNSIDAVVSPAFLGFLDALGADTTQVALTKNWWWVNSATPFVLFQVFYLTVIAIFYPIIACRQRRNLNTPKKPDGPVLRTVALVHNLFLAVLSLWMGVMTIFYVLKNKYVLWGEAFVESRDADIAWVFYIFYVSKYYEFVDTFLMLIKGNLRQVSFLHVFHHTSTGFIFWLVSRCAPGGDAWFCIAFNSWVHVVMYSYYFLTVVLKAESARKRYLWWGKYLTMFQMTQFFANLVHAIYAFWFSPYWYTGKVLQLTDMTILLGLFLNFYLKKHGEPEAGKAASVKGTTSTDAAVSKTGPVSVAKPKAKKD